MRNSLPLAMSGPKFTPDNARAPPRRPAPGPVRAAGDDDRKRSGDRGPGTAVITKTKPQTKRPSMYRVLILNDDYTPMELVVHVLERFFGKDHGGGDAHYFARASPRHRRMRGLYLRGGGDQGDAGHGLRPQTSASFAMRDGKEVSRGGGGRYKCEWKSNADVLP